MYYFICWNTIYSGKIGEKYLPYSVRSFARSEPTEEIFDHLVSNGEFLEILTSVTEPERKTLSFCISKLENDFGSYSIILQVCKKTAHLLVKNSPKSANGKYYIKPCLGTG